ncbi:ABC transporter permease [Conexibacter arvalis]|uniref:Peptide/nickel transport system permease protein n=1 Tax=Conexibacter arvalis TaxID=912552 RepID=A0A840I8S5_9ACTN|nr:ABC transporter permease [Conexibacter arvalis]MBB4660544.1 peptide/nickel transport system permease protein [Conexibacter arvalis]
MRLRTRKPPLTELHGSLSRDAWRRFRRHTLAVVALGVLGVLLLAVIVGPFVLDAEPERIDFGSKNLPPTLAHPMGTDELGRDQLARVLSGGRLTLAVATAAVLVAALLGVVVGAIAGYWGGLIDNALMRIVDVFYSLPSLFVVILLVTLVGASFGTIVAAIAAFTWMNTARLVRASYLSLKEREFVDAARSLGVGDVRIVVRHILPNALTPVIVSATLGIATAILTESALSFLGLGFQPPHATWGGMLNESRDAVTNLGHWWRGFFPGLMILVTVLCVNYVGDGARDALDPRKEER